MQLRRFLTPTESGALLETKPTRMCAVVVDLPDVNVTGVQAGARVCR